MSDMKSLKLAFALGLFATVTMGLGWSLLSGFFNQWELSTFDARLRLADRGSDNSPIVLIGRDAKSEKIFGAGLWDRALFATVIESLGKAGASVIALDFYFAGASPPERGGIQSDTKLLEAIHSTKNVILPLAVTLSEQSPSSLPPEFLKELPTSSESASSTLTPLNNVEVLPMARLISAPLSGLVSPSGNIGHIAASSDRDGVYRRVPSYLRIGKHIVPALGVAATAAYWDLPPGAIQLAPGSYLQFGEHSQINHPVRSLPIDEQGRFLINYAGRWTDSPFPYFSFIDIWEAIQEGREAEIRKHLSGKFVVLLHAALSADKRRTPLENNAPGGFVHANVIHTLLTGQGIRETTSWETGMIMAGIAIGIAWLGLTVSTGVYLGGASVISVLYLGASYLGIQLSGLVLPILPIFGTIGITMIATFLYTCRDSEAQIQALEREKVELYRKIAKTQELVAEHESHSEQLRDDLNTLREKFENQEEEGEALKSQINDRSRLLAQVHEQEQQTRARLLLLEKQLASQQKSPIGDFPLMPQEEYKALQKECRKEHEIITQDPTLLHCFRDLKRVAGTKTPIRILGENGTGKELFAKAAHRLSARQGEFIAVNTSAIPSELFESEIFGHKKGAFTGAAQDRVGLYEAANQGTLFLDEIGDLPLHQQAKLLRVLQEGVFTRVGETLPRKSDVRIVSATNKDLLKGIAEGWFREDLFYRLKGLEIRLPPLRERRGDLALLAMELVKQIVTGQHEQPTTFSPEALDVIQHWPWNGNIRELRNCLETAVSLAENGVIRPKDLRLSSDAFTIPYAPTEPFTQIPKGDPKKDDDVFLGYLRQHSFDLQATGQTLGWDRSTVMQRLKGMCFQTLVEKNGDLQETASLLAGEPGLTRLVRVKLKEYVQHLQKVIATFPSIEEAKTGCRKRFKNLPERYHEPLGKLVEKFFNQKSWPFR